MAILELAILYEHQPLLEKQFYSTSNVLDKNIRNSLLQTISGVVTEAFGEEIQSFSLGKFTITVITHSLDQEGGALSNSNKSSGSSHLEPLMMYCIVDQNSDDKIVLKTMKEAMNQFCNRFSVFDIQEKKIKKFKKFDKRLDKIFGDLILKSEDRFKSLF